MSNILPAPIYTTKYGQSYLGDSLHLLNSLASNSVDLVMTSPPFALQRKKSYGNEDQDLYVDWLLGFAPEIKRVLKDTGFYSDMNRRLKSLLHERSPPARTKRDDFNC